MLIKSIVGILLFFSLIAESYTQTESWIKDKSRACSKKREICAVGIGISLQKAKQNARVELAKIFHNRVTSDFKTKLTASSSTTYEEMSEEILESTKMALEGVEITKTHEDKVNFYALAVGNKRKMAKNFLKEINKIDLEMTTYVDDQKISSILKLEKSYIKRESLEKSYEFLTGRSIPSKISFDQIFKTKKAVLENIIIHVYLDEDDPKQIEETVSEILGRSGYKMTKGITRSKRSTHVVTGSLVAVKKYMKVKGFEKYELILNIAARNSRGLEMGTLTHSVVEVGRSYSQAYSKGISKLKDYLKENLLKLNIH